jgi:hypothetical protein
LALSGNVSLSIQATETSSTDLQTGSASLSQALSIVLSDGTGVNQANKIWSDSRSLAASASDTLDLSGAFTNIYGSAVNFTAIKFMFVQHTTVDASALLTVKPAAALGWASWQPTGTTGIWLAGATAVGQQGGFILLGRSTAAGYAVTAGTGDILTITAGPDVVHTYNIVLIGI